MATTNIQQHTLQGSSSTSNNNSSTDSSSTATVQITKEGGKRNQNNSNSSSSNSSKRQSQIGKASSGAVSNGGGGGKPNQSAQQSGHNPSQQQSHDDPLFSLKSKYSQQLKTLRELFGETWNDDDLIAVLQEVQGDLDRCIGLISEGHAQHWSTKESRKAKKDGRISQVVASGDSVTATLSSSMPSSSAGIVDSKRENLRSSSSNPSTSHSAVSGLVSSTPAQNGVSSGRGRGDSSAGRGRGRGRGGRPFGSSTGTRRPAPEQSSSFAAASFSSNSQSEWSNATGENVTETGFDTKTVSDSWTDGGWSTKATASETSSSKEDSSSGWSTAVDSKTSSFTAVSTNNNSSFSNSRTPAAAAVVPPQPKKKGTWAEIAKPAEPPKPVVTQPALPSANKNIPKQSQSPVRTALNIASEKSTFTTVTASTSTNATPISILNDNAIIDKKELAPSVAALMEASLVAPNNKPAETFSRPAAAPIQQPIQILKKPTASSANSAILSPAASSSSQQSQKQQGVVGGGIGVTFGSLSLNEDSEAIEPKKTSTIISSTARSTPSAQQTQASFHAPTTAAPASIVDNSVASQTSSHYFPQPNAGMPEYFHDAQRSTMDASQMMPGQNQQFHGMPASLANLYAAYFPFYMNFAAPNPYGTAPPPPPGYGQYMGAASKGYPGTTMYPSTAATQPTASTGIPNGNTPSSVKTSSSSTSNTQSPTNYGGMGGVSGMGNYYNMMQMQTGQQQPSTMVDDDSSKYQYVQQQQKMMANPYYGQAYAQQQHAFSYATQQQQQQQPSAANTMGMGNIAGLSAMGNTTGYGINAGVSGNSGIGAAATQQYSIPSYMMQPMSYMHQQQQQMAQPMNNMTLSSSNGNPTQNGTSQTGSSNATNTGLNKQQQQQPYWTQQQQSQTNQP